ncbi:MAG: cobalt-precorrin-8X methylmutase [Synechococcales cyanobacterium T60_A2020_003]|nr:cobalt-precorrin-8X methylmutase [Synechococcales cyanobacterium T60_A2020_003]
MASLNHPILVQSFAVIDREIGSHPFTPAEYAIVRRVIHSTADFEFKDLIVFSEGAIASGLQAIQNGCPIVTDVGMVKQGIQSLMAKTFGNPIIAAVEQAQDALPGKTRTETGLLHCWDQYPNAVYVIGNAPTALIALCDQMESSEHYPPLVVGVPVGFIAVVESKQRLAQVAVPQIRIQGRKGGSAVAAGIVNALTLLAWDGLESGE